MKAQKTKIKMLAAIVAVLAAGSAHATLANGIVDQWTASVAAVFGTSTICDSANDCTGPTGVTVVNPRSLRWGSSTGFGRSGLDITNSPSSATVNTNGAAVANVSITHLNRPITGTTLQSLDIVSTLTLTPFAPLATPASVPQQVGPTPITFAVNYLETPNDASRCADGGANGVGVNSAGCADIYVTDRRALNFQFFYDLDGVAGPLQNQLYFISFFEQTSGLDTLSSEACAAVGQAFPCLGFETPERQNTTVRFASLITTEPVLINVPEPGVLGLLGLGLAAIGFTRRRKV